MKKIAVLALAPMLAFAAAAASPALAQSGGTAAPGGMMTPNRQMQPGTMSGQMQHQMAPMAGSSNETQLSVEQGQPDISNRKGKDQREMEFVQTSLLNRFGGMGFAEMRNFRKIGENTGVWAEPSVVDKAANEFVEVDQMIAAAEKLYGPYRWGRYDILVLPPSFPFGGMENPRLTFATPTVLAGDRSLVSLVAHELAHSWSGNLVTNATWDDFWLNEGFTTYIESRLMEELRGKPYADMLRQLGRQNLEATVADLGPTSPDTRLHLDLTGRDPDAGMTDIAYEKGAAFLQTVESVVGREKLDAFLRTYFDNHAFKPMTSEQFVQYLNQNLLAGDESLANRVRVNEWINQPGVPDNVPPVRAEAFDVVDRAVAAFRAGTLPTKDHTAKWSTHEWLHFLRALPDTMSNAQLQALDAEFKFTQSGNSEILFQWLRTAIRNRYEPAFPALERFLTSQGRRKFLAPLYTDLAATDWGRPLALRIYERARPTYHSVAVGTIDGILGRSR